MAGTRPWELSAAFWVRAEPLLAPRTSQQQMGRPARSDRQMLGAMLGEPMPHP